MVRWTAIESLWMPKQEGYAGGFETVRRETQHEAYIEIVNRARNIADLDPRLTRSESSRSSNNSELHGGSDIFGVYVKKPEMAHFLPHSHICAPCWSILIQAVVGVDLETGVERHIAIASLQQLVNGKVKDDKRKSGVRYSKFNLLNLPRNHEDFFDSAPVLMLVPILGLEEVKAWRPGTEYWVMVIIGNYEEDADYWYRNVFPFEYEKLVQRLGADNVGLVESEATATGTKTELEKTTELVSHYVKAEADVLMGRGIDGSLQPLDFLTDDTDMDIKPRKEQLEQTKEKLHRKKKVKVPFLTGKKNPKILKLKISGENIPDPALLACKAAVTWSERCGEKLLPSCGSREPKIDPDEKIMYELGAEEYDAAVARAIRPPDSLGLLAKGLSGSSSVAVVTPEK